MKYKALKVGFSRRMLIISSCRKFKLNNDFTYKISDNSGIVFGKRKNMKGSAVTGIMTSQVQQRKYLTKSIYIV